MDIFSNINEKEPQAPFVGLAFSLQPECAYIQHVSDHPGKNKSLFEHELANSFNPDIFGVKQVQEDLLQIKSLPLIITGLGTLHPSQEAPPNHATSRASNSHGISEILGGFVHLILTLIPSTCR